jgi:hypothetical protein
LSAPIENMHTLRDAVRPVHGGYQLNFLDAAGVRTVSFLCTMGFNVVKDGRASFITNSHCTNHQGGTETPTEYYQPTMDPDGDRLVNREYFIATEVDDPHYDAVSCAMEVLPGTVCRYSDAARAEYAAGVPFTLGRIARTTEGYQDTPFTHDPITGDRIRNPVLTVDSLNPTFSIKGEQRASVLGEIVHKVGRTTGWTFGPVIQTCLNSVVLGTVPAIVQRCQDRVRADVAGGDSGSPVFRRLGNGSNVRLSGILWGGSVSGEVTFVFSPMANVRRELQLLDARSSRGEGRPRDCHAAPPLFELPIRPWCMACEPSSRPTQECGMAKTAGGHAIRKSGQPGTACVRSTGSHEHIRRADTP